MPVEATVAPPLPRASTDFLAGTRGVVFLWWHHAAELFQQSLLKADHSPAAIPRLRLRATAPASRDMCADSKTCERNLCGSTKPYLGPPSAFCPIPVLACPTDQRRSVNARWRPVQPLATMRAVAAGVARRQARLLGQQTRGLALAAELTSAEESPFLRFATPVPQPYSFQNVLGQIPETKVRSSSDMQSCRFAASSAGTVLTSLYARSYSVGCLIGCP